MLLPKCRKLIPQPRKMLASAPPQTCTPPGPPMHPAEARRPPAIPLALRALPMATSAVHNWPSDKPGDGLSIKVYEADTVWEKGTKSTRFRFGGMTMSTWAVRRVLLGSHEGEGC